MSNIVYQATYSGVPVFELVCRGIPMMRRRADNFLNATQILKVAQFDKPQRTRILEREVQVGQHEKVQGGYGKYQGTWVPFERGIQLASQYHIDDIMQPLLEFDPSGESPPLAPKHQVSVKVPKNAFSSKSPKLPKRDRVKRKKSDDENDSSPNLHVSPLKSGSSPQKRGRKKIPKPPPDEKTYAFELLDSFINHNSEFIPKRLFDGPDHNHDINIIIDDEGHTALHWAAALARVQFLKLLIKKGADVKKANNLSQTALMRSIMFSNNFDSRCFPEVIKFLKDSMECVDEDGRNVLHHIVIIGNSQSNLLSAKYYLDCILEFLKDENRPEIIMMADKAGDTAMTLAANLGLALLVNSFNSFGPQVLTPSTDMDTKEGLVDSVPAISQELKAFRPGLRATSLKTIDNVSVFVRDFLNDMERNRKLELKNMDEEIFLNCQHLQHVKNFIAQSTSILNGLKSIQFGGNDSFVDSLKCKIKDEQLVKVDLMVRINAYKSLIDGFNAEFSADDSLNHDNSALSMNNSLESLFSCYENVSLDLLKMQNILSLCSEVDVSEIDEVLGKFVSS